MNFVVGNLTEPVFRPPSEWDALLLAVTNGCTHRCTFCSMYRTKKFEIRKEIDDIKREIDQALALYGNRVRKIFLEDGNAFTVKPEILIEITEYCHKVHPNLEKVSAYAHAKDIVKKSDEELKDLAQAGFTMVYVGVESGDDEVLKACRKGTNQDEFELAAQKCHRAGIAWSGIFLLGLAGNDPDKSRKHALESAKLINRMAPPTPIPWYISPLTLEIAPGSDLWTQQQNGEFQTGSFIQILEELYTMIEYTDDSLRNCVFNTNHASNYLSLKGQLGEQKQEFLGAIKKAINYTRENQHKW
ncbi:MAG: radical SAM protein [Deltaproteobacteria bacterium]|nr:radical SAM protein [Deltaproteobacteria bacterium]MBT4267408.1 radical SAM protein [Deltaproteobacteria bacterium]MBT4641767.1 radical SAM protein [Deltaproteobacteria bacterium]MBT6613289.1 radical SAM protein [Deltaproteobacteria bacterium]MBT7154295.1 radical SAM protein [Deltaproteobacteria bacterium]